MSHRPELVHRATSATIKPGDVSKSESQKQPEAITDHAKTDAVWLFCILVMLVWPWIFFGVVWKRKGIQATNGFANFITDNPQKVNFVVTFIGTIVRFIVAYLFSKAILRYSQKWVTEHLEAVKLFHVTLISAFKSQNLPWGIGDFKYLMQQKRWLRVILVGTCIGTLILVPSGTTSLLNPVPFDRTALLHGTEVDFSSTAPDCLSWLENNPISNDCDWEVYNGLNYTTCLGQNQMVDVLESGRGNILSLISNNTESAHYSQLGAKSGLQFLGPIRGILPIGPDGVPAFDTLDDNSPLSSPHALAGMLSYNYTLMHQGISSDVSCKYDHQSPVGVFPIIGDNTGLILQYNGTCGDGQADVLKDVEQFIALNSNNSLTFWACKSPPSELQNLSYFIYLRGRADYQAKIGNITCTVSPIQPAIFNVTYHSITKTFSLSQPGAIVNTTFSGFIDQSLVALGGLVEESQSGQANEVAESVITFGVKSFGLPEGGQIPEYLRLYEAMIQGVLEYLTTYTRLLISTDTSRPSSCTRTVEGLVTFRVIGWTVKTAHIGYLLPMTIVNLASLIVLLVAIFKSKVDSYESDLIDAKSLVIAEHHVSAGDSTGWEDGVVYRHRMELQPSRKGDF